MSKKLIEVEDLKVSFYTEKDPLQVIRGFDLELDKGEIVGILGESGSGKTVSASTIMRLMTDEEGRIDSGEIFLKDDDLVNTNDRALRKIRGKNISYVFQNPEQALTPYKKIGKQLTDTLKNHNIPYSKTTILNALKEVGINDPSTVYKMYPFQLSGGQNQRVMIAQCLLCKPDLIIADEPTSSIDASLRKRVLDLFCEINKTHEISIILITHDFDIAKYACSRILIMYGGLVVEEATTDQILNYALHPYTEELMKCARSLDSNEEKLYTLEGRPLTPYEFKDECPFYSRCKYRKDECLSSIPEMAIIGDRKVRCIPSVIKERTE